MSILNNLSEDRFLSDFWQKKPLVIKQAYPDFQCPIDANDLAGLAGEESAESRLVLEHGDSESAKPWQVKHGPFNEADFAKLPKSHYTLLVQAVDHWLPEIKDMAKDFRFLPSWRMDDIMISYAPTGGSVGPHYDHYDTFLIQAQGTRRWKLSGHCDEHHENIADIPLRLIKDWHTSEEHLMQPGDMLYVPTGYGHHGISESDDCMTISVGFRAPSSSEMMSDFARYLSDKLSDDLRLEDPEQVLQNNAGEISASSLARVKQSLLEQINDSELLSSWFGQLMSEPKYPDKHDNDYDIDADDIELRLEDEEEMLERNLSSRFAFIVASTDIHKHKLFIDHKEWHFDNDLLPLIKHLCSGDDIDKELIKAYWSSNDNTQQNKQCKQLISQLIQLGALVFVYDDEQDQ
jgi:50S ribosomal protein L16 3-hydroxylase